MRTLAIGDIHGCSSALQFLLETIELRSDDLLIALGDYVDRGPDTRGVLDHLIDLHLQENLICLRGNHELMMLSAEKGNHEDFRFWLSVGGREALESYGEPISIQKIPDHHWRFLKTKLSDWYETDTHIFVHANLHPSKPLSEQTSLFIHWEFLDPMWHRPHQSGKIMICGHSTQKNGLPLNLGSAICLDTGACKNGWLTCLHVETGDYWQANDFGETRKGNIRDIEDHL